MKGLTMFEPGSTLRGLLLMAMGLALLSGCAGPGASVTERTICRELRAALPSWGEGDTAQSIEEGAGFIVVFEAACPS
jgi:hypothetical protein